MSHEYFSFDDDQEPEIDPQILEQARELAESLEQAASEIGLHATHLTVGHDPENPSRQLVQGTFLIGDLALSDRVQYPELQAERDVMTDLEVDAAIDEHQAMIDAAERRRRELRGED